MNTVSSIASTPVTLPTVTPQRQTGADTRNTLIPTSPEPQISPTAKALAGFYEAASAFVQKEHLESFTGWKYDSKGYVLNNEGAYMDVERYNNYLFDKAATTLVNQARQMGLTLDKDETLAQLKADNADIAAIRFNNDERVKNLGASVSYTSLTYGDVKSLTDMYIAAKENGLDATQVSKSMDAMAFSVGNHNRLRDVPMFSAVPEDQIAVHDAPYQSKIDLAGEIKAKLALTASNVFGFEYESEFFENLLNPRYYLLDIPDSTLNFLSQLLDIYSQKQAL
jgi:hypothetical protein